VFTSWPPSNSSADARTDRRRHTNLRVGVLPVSLRVLRFGRELAALVEAD
jgi:hypothetical protein